MFEDDFIQTVSRELERWDIMTFNKLTWHHEKLVIGEWVCSEVGKTQAAENAACAGLILVQKSVVMQMQWSNPHL